MHGRRLSTNIWLREHTDYTDTRAIRESLRALGLNAKQPPSSNNFGGDGEVILDLSHPRIATVTLQNPLRRNAVTPRMMAQLADCIDRLEEEVERADAEASAWQQQDGMTPASLRDKPWDGTCVVLKGHGSWFCAGMDLGVLNRSEQITLVGTQDEEEEEQAGRKHFAECMSALMADSLNRMQNLPLISVVGLRVILWLIVMFWQSASNGAGLNATPPGCSRRRGVRWWC
jgi:hypothetical protein